jgi:hypothetical protein
MPLPTADCRGYKGTILEGHNCFSRRAQSSIAKETVRQSSTEKFSTIDSIHENGETVTHVICIVSISLIVITGTWQRQFDNLESRTRKSSTRHTEDMAATAIEAG